MFLKVLLVILVLIYAFWGIFHGKFIFPSRFFNNPNVIEDIKNVYLIFSALLLLGVFMVFSIVKSSAKYGYTKTYNYAANFCLIASIMLFILGFQI